ncbi:DUF1295 domain-containing protein [Adhaeretor mobilis]|uniref:3-oxo-5-alpha-steroid 4-dehydrogenase n=1 Tax=Adhaeretor mobilis TaxID=1930276 RepID=A0A517MT99_9BACT|nr:DUF1295 domain-containing protein [Adhaeretor mobilis]QDS98017.1 3-oxo-5-alpha-steroid 4-dehydrogenase [Adhaeretor mobilis]
MIDFQLLIAGLIAAIALMIGLWFVQRRTGNAGIVDVAWGASIGVLGLAFALLGTALPGLRWLVGGMIGVWALRYTSHLYTRVVGEPEEGRYKELRRAWGEKHDWKMFLFYMFQAFGAWVFSLGVFAIAHGSWPTKPLVGFAVALWIVGIAGNSISDWQLKQFKQSPDSKGKTCRRGLWRYSRHPNYFFEWIHWCSYIPLAWASPLWWLAPLVALSLLYLLLFMTGIPPTEKQALASRGDDYREYQRTTSMFVPWFPKA